MGNNIAGKVVVITGASSGLGEATARLFTAQGASVALGARRADRLKTNPYQENSFFFSRSHLPDAGG